MFSWWTHPICLSEFIQIKMQTSLHKPHEHTNIWYSKATGEPLCVQGGSPRFTLLPTLEKVESICETCESWWMRPRFTHRNYESITYECVRLVKAISTTWFFSWGVEAFALSFFNITYTYKIPNPYNNRSKSEMHSDMILENTLTDLSTLEISAVDNKRCDK